MRPRLTYANVVSSLALFLVLTGGAAYALDGSNTVFTDDIVNGEVKEGDIGDGEVTSAEIANGRVKTADIGDGEVRSGNVANDNLTGGDIAGNSLKGADIDESTLSSIGGGGPAGGDLTGTYPDPEIAADAVGAAEIARGSVGSSELASNLILFFDSTSVPSGGGVGEVTVSCPPDSVVLNGGAEFEFPSGDLSRSRIVNVDGWSAEGQNNGGVAQDLFVYALCLTRVPGDA